MRLVSPVIALLCASIISIACHAAEGMWTLDNLPRAQLQATYQFDPDDAWIHKVMHASLRLAQGCSAAFVSPTGLVLTNHHCAQRCIEAISTPRRNFIEKGFLALSPQKEVSCPDLEINQLQEITDVTARIQEKVQGKTGRDFTLAYNAIAAELTGQCIDGDESISLRCDVVSLYHGGRYFLYRYRRYQDVRLVWAPEFAIAFFGGDPDNFNFPRYDLDASILRVYENGKPVTSPDFFRINSAGAVEGELTMVLGHPGATQRELTVEQLLTLRDDRLVRTLLLYSELRGVLEQYGKSSREAARIANGELFSIENSIKVFHGQLDALNNETLMNRKRQEEQELQHFVATHGKYASVAPAWDEITRAEKVYRQIGDQHYFVELNKGCMSKYCNFARILVRAAEEKAKPDKDRLPEYTDAALPALEQTLFSAAPVYPEFEKVKLSWSLTKLREWLGVDSAIVQTVLHKESPDAAAAKWVATTHLGNIAVRHLLWDKPELVFTSDDPFIRMELSLNKVARSIRHRFDAEVEGAEQRAGRAIAEARFAMTGANSYPDATFTLRLSYGKVKGWQEGERGVPPFTYFKGAYQRNTGAPPFALPASWLNARPKLDMNTPFDFVTTNDIIGGNSGSPVINRDAELVGVAFDGNIHALGGAFGYDGNVNRAVILDSAALLSALRNIYHADALLRELNAK